MLKGKKIVVGITGSIAAYKIPFLIRLLVREGAEVRVIMTPVATDFVTPLTLATLSQNAVIIDPFKANTGEWNNHVELGQWADLMIFAPVTANTLGKMVNGIAPVKRNRFVSLESEKKILNQNLIDKAYALAGIKGYVTNLNISSQEIINAYHQLFQVVHGRGKM